jgi:hypothetical protein
MGEEKYKKNLEKIKKSLKNAWQKQSKVI